MTLANSEKDTCPGLPVKHIRKYSEETIDHRLQLKKSLWEKIMPEQHLVQFAGGMGMFNFGSGWEYGSQRQWETDILVGFIPRFSSDKIAFTVTLKQNYLPWKIALGKHFSFHPLTCGLYINTVLDPEFWVTEPEKYPNAYYKFSTRIRFHAFVGEQLNYAPIPSRPNTGISFFYELSACDLYLITALPNKTLSFADIVGLSIGVKIRLSDR